MARMFTAAISIVLLLLVGCSGPQRVNEVAARLDIGSKGTNRYHYLADVPFANGLAREGYIVALEKSPRAKVGYIERESYKRRFRFPVGRGNEPRTRHLDKTINHNSKALFVSHIVAYEPDPGGARQGESGGHAFNGMRTRFVYNIHPDRGAPTVAVNTTVPVIHPNSDYYDNGWRALEQSLYREIEYKLRRANTAGRPYTHLLFSTMGWDNDQPESIRRYNAIVGQMIEQARRDPRTDVAFRPLVIGITWPSVWGWQSWFNLRQIAYKVVGYANKSDDADEIGYTYANWLVNKLGLDMRAEFADAQPRLRVMAIGHSFGARIMSRAVFSRDLLKVNAHPQQTVDLLAGLQGAFSVNRFIPEAGNEGYPYAGLPGMRGLVLMTTSTHDKANPMAYYLSRARHIGGKRGLEQAWKPENAAFFYVPELDGPRLNETACALRGKVVVVDATDYVYDHNDVLTQDMGALLWSATRCASARNAPS